MRSKKIKDKFISLQEATKYCSYSRDYLNLRVRQGKLKAVKIGRNWVTKKEWLKLYSLDINSYKKKPAKRAVKKHKNKPVSSKLKITATRAVAEKPEENHQYPFVSPNKAPRPPANLPVGEFSIFTPYYRIVSLQKLSAICFGLMCSLFFVGIIFAGIYSIPKIEERMHPARKIFIALGALTETMGEAGNKIIKNTAGVVVTYTAMVKDGQAQEVLYSTRDVFSEYGIWLKQGARSATLIADNALFEAKNNLAEISLVLLGH